MSNKENIREIILIGRDRDCNFICNDSSVSRHHAQIIDYGTSCSVVDVGSTNGSFVNGNRVGTETTLHAGDELRVGNVVVPWQQLVQPPMEPKSNKKLLWILIPIIAALLIGGGLAVYFIYGHAKYKDKEAENDKRELVDVLSKKITENEEQVKKLEEEQRAAEEAREGKLLAQEEEKQAIIKRDAAIAEVDKAKADAQAEVDKAKADALAEVDKAKADAQAEVDKVKAEAQAEADKIKAEVDSVNEAANKIVLENEFIDQLLDSLDEEQLSSVCRELGITFHYYQFPAKRALKKAFWDGSIETKQKITMALKEKQRISTNKSKD